MGGTPTAVNCKQRPFVHCLSLLLLLLLKCNALGTLPFTAKATDAALDLTVRDCRRCRTALPPLLQVFGLLLFDEKRW